LCEIAPAATSLAPSNGDTPGTQILKEPGPSHRCRKKKKQNPEITAQNAVVHAIGAKLGGKKVFDSGRHFNSTARLFEIRKAGL